MTMIQNFSVPRGNDATINVDVTSDVAGETLHGADIEWKVYEQMHGVRTASVNPLIVKRLGAGITVPGSPPMLFVIGLDAIDTSNLLENFYHEAMVTDEGGNKITVLQGVMTVTEAEIPA